MDLDLARLSGPPASDIALARAPAPWFLSGEDGLQLQAFNTAAGVTLTCVGRFRNLEGLISPFVFTLTPNTGGTLSPINFGLGEGWLLNVTVFVSAGTPTSTQCVVLLRVIRGLGAAAQQLGTLAQGFVTTTQDVAWPLTIASASGSSLATGAIIRSIAVTTPAAGAEFSQTVDAGKRWLVQALHARLVTSAAVANRFPALRLDDGTNVLSDSPQTNPQAASQTWDHNWFPGATISAGLTQAVTTPSAIGSILGPGFRIRSITLNLQAGDQWSLIQLLVEEWGN